MQEKSSLETVLASRIHGNNNNSNNNHCKKYHMPIKINYKNEETNRRQKKRTQDGERCVRNRNLGNKEVTGDSALSCLIVRGVA